MEYLDEYRLLTDICLNITDDCNLECKYCFVSQQPNYMTLENAKAAVDYIAENIDKKRETREAPDLTGFINFFGGEPMLLWDEIMVPLIEYTEQQYPLKIDFGMTTNGTLLTEERIRYLKEHNVSLLLSIDGDKETQDFNRPCRTGESSFDKLADIIPILLAYYPDITFRSTIYAPTAKHTFENFVFADLAGFRNIFMIPNSRDSWSEEEKEILREELGKIFDYLTWRFKQGEKPISFSTIEKAYKDILEHDIAVYNKEEVDLKISRGIFRCGLGITFGSIGYDGNIYACQEQDSQGKNSKFYIGNIFEGGVDKNLHSQLLEEYSREEVAYCENKEMCESCPRRIICQEPGCPSTTQDLFNDFFITPEMHCLWERWIFEECSLQMKKLVPENNLIFKEYLDKDCGYEEYFREEDKNG